MEQIFRNWYSKLKKKFEYTLIHLERKLLHININNIPIKVIFSKIKKFYWKMWHCFALQQVSLMSDVTEVTRILIKEFNSLPHLTSCSIREAPLPIWEKQEWKRNAMPWCYSNNTFHLADFPRKGLWEPLRWREKTVTKGRASLCNQAQQRPSIPVKWKEA